MRCLIVRVMIFINPENEELPQDDKQNANKEVGDVELHRQDENNQTNTGNANSILAWFY